MSLIVKTTLMFFLFAFSLKTSGQSIVDKTFEAQTGETCVEMSDGVYMIEFYKILVFKKDTVNVINRTNNYNDIIDKSKIYTWKIIDNEIKIEGFNDYKNITLLDSILVAKDFSGNKISFKETEYFSFEK